ncbi:MAG: flavodoxin-dependent (E)-4-hydroxy-3-methylbut-2-enyl-diphosphate synthase [Planctomycetes bacterium]|nr:flavodoxin-dependent (E)-4-hydroxy-3-methylbut-2-enyl-diphosphate synthase [Planctomycetota bacterium]
MITPKRRKTREVSIGNITIGGNNAIAVQSMCTTKTSDLDKTMGEIKTMLDKGCEIIRVSIFDQKDIDVIPAIKKQIHVPIVADIHFRASFAEKVMKAGIDKVRINPGNILEQQINTKDYLLNRNNAVKKLVQQAKNLGISIRIGVNSGSVEKDLIEKYGYPSSDSMVESALRYIEVCESVGFTDIVVSLKSTDILTTLENYRNFSKLSDYPVHLGLTEAGAIPYGIVKSAIGLSPLLMEGIGDTIRISLTDEPWKEVEVAYDILKATGARITGPEVIACPKCGRIQIDLDKIVSEVNTALKVKGISLPIKISLLGCAVNGPGEAREADIGIAGGDGEALIFRNGEKVRKVKEKDIVQELINEIETMQNAKILHTSEQSHV